MTFKALCRAEQIARYRCVSGLKDREIAALVGLRPSGLSRVLATSEYKAIAKTVFQKHLAELDRVLMAQLCGEHDPTVQLLRGKCKKTEEIR